MNRWTCMGLLSAATAALAGASTGGCVTGDIPAQQGADGGSSSSSSSGVTGDDGGGQASSSGASSSSGAGSSSGASSSSGAGSSSGTGSSSGASSGGSSGSGSGSTAAGDGGLPLEDGGPTIPLVDGGAVPCIDGVRDFYVIRGDQTAMIEPNNAAGIPVVDSVTSLPLTGIVDVAGGAYHGCALLEDSSMQCWADTAANGNVDGQLGNGTTTAGATTYRSTPVLTGVNAPLTGIVRFAVGAESTIPLNSTCAVSADGKMWCWGDLTWIVNNGTSLHSPYAQAITTNGTAPLTGVIQAAYATTGGCAVVQGSPNAVWCWGYNAAGELAQGTVTANQYPIQVHGLNNPSKVVITDANGSDNTVCVIDGENVKCWGYGSAIAGTNVAVQTPTLIVNQSGAALDGVVDLVPGTTAFSALRTDQTLWDWGSGFTTYASNYGLTNVVALGYAGGYGGNGPRFVTNDGIYHNAMSPVSINCNMLQ